MAPRANLVNGYTMLSGAHNVLMNKNELKNVSALGLSPVSLAKLLEVTPRAISSVRPSVLAGMST